ncbi:MAG: hypothetical protein ACOCV1_03470 [Bacillota bacterium]
MSKFIIYQVDNNYDIIRKITQRKEKFSRKELVKMKKKFNMELIQREVSG